MGKRKGPEIDRDDSSLINCGAFPAWRTILTSVRIILHNHSMTTTTSCFIFCITHGLSRRHYQRALTMKVLMLLEPSLLRSLDVRTVFFSSCARWSNASECLRLLHLLLLVFNLSLASTLKTSPVTLSSRSATDLFLGRWNVRERC